MLSNFALLDIARRWNLRLSLVNTAFEGKGALESGQTDGQSDRK